MIETFKDAMTAVFLVAVLSITALAAVECVAWFAIFGARALVKFAAAPLEEGSSHS